MFFSIFNTNTLAYKLLSGSLRNKRKHSEQLNKFVAGLFDTDGCIGLFHYKTRVSNQNKLKIVLTVQQSAVNDPDFQMLRSLQSFYNRGSLYYSYNNIGTEASFCAWTLRDKDAKAMYNIISKHMRLKATHFNNLIWLTEECKDILLTDNHILELKEFSECSIS